MEDKKKRRNTAKQKNTVKRKRKRRNQQKTDVISITILIVAVCVFVFSLYQLAMLLVPYYFGGQEYDEVKKLVITTEKTAEGEEKFQVDFEALQEENSDTVAWIRFDEPAVISYPVVKGMDNDLYLTKTFSASDNKLGAIFMDYRNASSFSDRNTIIYGHNLKVGGEMFSQLNAYGDEAFYKEHPYFYIYTPDGKTRTYQVFVAGVVSDQAENYTLEFESDETYLAYLEACKNSSAYQTDASDGAGSSIVTLSTCTNVRDDERFIVQGVLVSEE